MLEHSSSTAEDEVLFHFAGTGRTVGKVEGQVGVNLETISIITSLIWL
jgi:hypothetical protein